MKVMAMDPGKQGAFIQLDLSKFKLQTTSVPLIKVKGTKPELDQDTLYTQVTNMLRDSDFFIIEDVHSMPRDGVVSAFSFGYFKGFIDCCLQGARWRANDPRVYRTPPQVWKAALGLLKDKSLPKNQQVKEAKARAIRLAHAMFPQCVDILDTEGKCEAVLLAVHWIMGDGHNHARMVHVRVEGDGHNHARMVRVKVDGKQIGFNGFGSDWQRFTS